MKGNPRKKLLIPAGSQVGTKYSSEPLIFSGLSVFVTMLGATLWQFPIAALSSFDAS